MKIAQILYSGLGGHGSVAFSLMDGVKKGPYQFIFGFLGIEQLLPSYGRKCIESKVAYKYFKAISGRPFYIWPRITLWLYRQGPNVIILHSVKAIIPCLLYTLIKRVPLVFVEHQANSLKARADWWATRFGMIFADRIVYLTQDYADEIKSALGPKYKNQKIEVIPNGIDVVRFSPALKFPVNRSRIVIGMAARFTENRRQDVLIDVIKKLSMSESEFDCHLTLAGDGETFDRVYELVCAQGLEGRVTLTGRIDEAKLIEWFQGLDIYVHATEGETLSTSMLQAMACGLPIVASDVPGVNGLFNSSSEEFGVLIKEQDSAEFCAAIKKLGANPERMNRLSRAARYVAETAYSHTVMAERYSSLIEELIK